MWSVAERRLKEGMNEDGAKFRNLGVGIWSYGLRGSKAMQRFAMID